MGDSVVATFRPSNGQNLDNIPHLLRYWADRIERGEVSAETALLVLVEDQHRAPSLCIFGQNMAPAALGGTLMACAMLPLQLLKD